MTITELLEIIRKGENSGVEFKRDDVRPKDLAKEIVALLNLEGGCIVLGIEDDGSISGLVREPKEAEEWVMEIGRTAVSPAIIPFWELFEIEGKPIGVIILPADSPDKPYKARRGPTWTTLVRVGSTSREATREEEIRLYQASGHIHYDITPVSGATLNDLDLRRLTNYFRDIRQQECPDLEDESSWQRLLVNTELMVSGRDRSIPTTGGLLLFGYTPNRFVRQAGVTAVAYPGNEKDYTAKERSILRGPGVALRSRAGEVVENGVIEMCMDFVRRNTMVEAWIGDDGQRREKWDYSLEAVREAIVNAIAHRDYTIAVVDIELSIYGDRLEVLSPGRLPNTVTVEKMKYGYRATRNELIKEVLRDYRYVEATGLGVPRKIIRGMREHNGTEPDLIEEEDRFIVRLWK